MNNLPRQKLGELIEKYGSSLYEEPKRCEGMLRDLCGQYRREIAVLISAINQNLVAEMLEQKKNNIPPKLFLGRLARQMQDNLAIAEDASAWAVESWAIALGIISDTSTVERVTLEPKYAPVTTKYTLILNIVGNVNNDWRYTIDLEEAYEDNPKLFFSKSNGKEQGKFTIALEAVLGRKVQSSEVERILQQWCKQISFGYRSAYMECHR
ncbi:MAG: hypothetical protein F6K31_33625 [Symploca sp. SIO2G7]|nr:hypothetical protein [Symploca sp. SIO2G7]